MPLRSAFSKATSSASILLVAMGLLTVTVMVFDSPSDWRIALGAVGATIFVILLNAILVHQALAANAATHQEYIDRIDKSVQKYHESLAKLVSENHTIAQEEREKFKRQGLDTAKQYVWLRQQVEDLKREHDATKLDFESRIKLLQKVVALNVRTTGIAVPEEWTRED